MKFRWQNAVLLALVCAIVGCGVALTYSVAAPRIEAQAQQRSESARRALFPKADSFEAQSVSEESGLDNCYSALREGELLGYIAQTTVSGSQGMIEIIAGVDAEGRVVGIRVGGSGFSETPNLGARVKDADFTSQFEGLTRPAELKGNIDGITGATISSEAVVRGANLIAEALRALLGQ